VVERVLLDRLAVDLGDGVAGHAAAAGGEDDRHREGAQDQEKSHCLVHREACSVV
jgi:hypothetical protein